MDTIEGVQLQPLKQFKDERGEVMHMVRKDSPLFKEFSECYFSFTNPGVVKGWKKHFKATQLFATPIGEMKIVIFDDREDSQTRGKTWETTLSPDNYQLLRIPPQVWYALKATSAIPGLIVNITTEMHDPEESTTRDLNDPRFPTIH